MSYTLDRNPSPPAEILLSDDSFVPDRIGSSLYSKRWLYRTLMNMLKFVQEYPSMEEKSAEESLMQTEDSAKDLDLAAMMELDPHTEEEACTLWDMSASQEVAEFLCGCEVADVFLEIIENTKSPRLLEIVVGILGNMSTFNSTCDYVVKNKVLVNAIINLSGCTDSCTLVQLFRLFTCGIVRESCQEEWFSSFNENSFFMENLKGILENNLCRDVLKGLLEFLDTIFNYNSSYCSMWGEQSYTLAIIECGNQLMKCGSHEDLDILFTVINTLCQQSSNVLTYGRNFDALRPVFHAYFLRLGEEDYVPPYARVTAVTNTFALYGNLLYSGNIQSEHIIFDIAVLRAILKISMMVKQLLYNMTTKLKKQNHVKKSSPSEDLTMTRERNGDTSDDEDSVQSWSTLLEAIAHAAKACITLTNEVTELQILEEIITLQKSIED